MDANSNHTDRIGTQPVAVEPAQPAVPRFLSPFAAAVDDCMSAGLTEAILPVIPPGAAVSKRLENSRGKIPGRLCDGSWFGFTGWTQHVTTLEDIALWRTWPDAGLCIRTAVLPALDIDVDDLGLSRVVWGSQRMDDVIRLA